MQSHFCQVRFTESKARERVEAHLRSHRERWTPARELVLMAIFQQSGTFSCSTLHSSLLSDKGVSIAGRHRPPDWVTVLRALQFFKKVGILKEADINENQTLYEVASTDETHHHHYVICNFCDQKTVIDQCSIQPLLKKLEATGFENLTHSFEVRGICPRCRDGNLSKSPVVLP